MGSYNLGSTLEGNSSQKLEVQVNTDDQGMLNVLAVWEAGYNNAALSQFLPEGDPNRTEGSDGFARSVWRKACAGARWHGFRNRRSPAWARGPADEQNPPGIDHSKRGRGNVSLRRQSTTQLLHSANATREAWLAQTQLVAVAQSDQAGLSNRVAS